MFHSHGAEHQIIKTLNQAESIFVSMTCNNPAEWMTEYGAYDR